jgi:hypothetical protein
MRTLVSALLLACLTVVCPVTPAAAQSISDKVGKAKRIDGFVPLYWDESAGKLWMEITRFDTELLYQVSLSAGLGSNPVSLDRAALGDTHVVTFQRVGPKVLMVEPNYRYRALTSDQAELRAVRDSFAQSVLWGFKVEATDGNRVLVDATALFLRDGYGVTDRLRQTKQGAYRLDDSRSAFYLPRTKGFPKNTEIETTLTFTTEGDPGSYVAQVTPAPLAVTLREHHSFIELPPLDAPDAYKPRVQDPRIGVFGIEFNDYASPITDPIEKRWIVRHRLRKKDPAAAVSEAVTPIVYYVDNGAPEPIRTALVEGASWWSAAFEAAGFTNAFQVKVLPADADPLDVRYNVINWVHRSSRGWSYGGSIVDPRTGEILKGHVTLGSLRVRQDYMLGTGMIPSFASAQGAGGSGASASAGLGMGVGIGGGVNDGMRGACELGFLPDTDYLAEAAGEPATDSAAMAIARIRQLSAHEVGHTLGFAHNFAASTYGRASVMDYPAPMVEIKAGALDLTHAYATGIGAYDKWAVDFAYAQFAPGADEKTALETILTDGVAAGMIYITDTDARPAGAAHPLATLWDNGSDPVATLRHEMQVRQIGLSKFGLTNVPAGSSLSLLEAKLLPLYLHHRYQLNAAMKSLGGAYYSYSVRGAGGGASPAQVQQIVPPAVQRTALAAVMETIAPEALDIPDTILALIPPVTDGFGSTNTELFSGRTSPLFDPLAAAGVAADLTISGLLQPQRAGRLVSFHARDAANPDFNEVLRTLIRDVWVKTSATPRLAAIRRTVQHLIVSRLMDLASNDQAMPQVRADATDALRDIMAIATERGLSIRSGTVPTGLNPTTEQSRFARAVRDDIDRFLKRPDSTFKPITPLPTPAGDPIGAAATTTGRGSR